ncbi:MAG: hypothetical protein M2R45_02025 [Verrucomicrobia subdivision 3 bacterium]|nr:hypothetical protein [Limisphaerales bacterium]MCS1414844.1 hypothetical protein [Limisphaerales bacterium]
MAGTSIESSIRFNQIFWFGVIGLGALFTGFYLASNKFTLVLAMIVLGWLVLLPYHAKLASYLSIVTFRSALILPYFPGRPYMWEFAAFLAWSGLIITVSLRRYAPDAAKYIQENRWLFVGVVFYCIVLIATMVERGFGLRIMGTAEMGGRFYFQQLMCAIFPVLFVLVRFPEMTLIRLYVFQCLLTLTFLVSDFVFSLSGGSLFGMLQFFELPGDATNFERQAQQFGIRRFQSLSVMGQGLMLLILVFHRLDDFFSKKALYLFPLVATVFGIGLLSGHRYLSLILMISTLFIAYTQRFYNLKNVLISFGMIIAVLIPLILYAEKLPLSAQRALSYIPGIKIDHRARINGTATMETRRILRNVGIQMIPQYFWMGRGFMMPSRDYSHIWDPTYITMHVNQGKFYNGFIGLMVNTGVFGTLSMLIFLGAGSYLAISIMAILREHGCYDAFARVSCVVASVWMANIIAFLLFHGDSEFAMKTFSLQAGLMIACKRCLDYRISDESPEDDNPLVARRVQPVF